MKLIAFDTWPNMTLRLYLLTMLLATFLCWLSFGLVLINVDPQAATWLTLGFFYASLFLSLAGTSSLVLLLVYSRVHTDDVPMFAYVSKSFREGNVLAAFISLTLFLQGMNWLSWWTGSLLLTACILTISLLWSLSPRRESPNLQRRTNSFI